MKELKEDGVSVIGGTPTNSTGAEIAGIGIGKDGEPGVDKKNKKKVMTFKDFIKR